MRRFVLIDRDGTLIVDKHYLADPAGVELIPGSAAALARLRTLGLGVAVVTNQSGLARGYFDQASLDAVHARMAELLAADGVRLDGLFVCPHRPDDDCSCRKPLPGLALRAAEALGFDPARAFVIGDKEADVGLGHAVGATSILVRTGYGRKAEAAGTAANHVVDDLPAACELIERLAG